MAAPLLQLTPCLTQRRMARKPVPAGPGRLSLAHVSPHPAQRLGALSPCVAASDGPPGSWSSPGVGGCEGGLVAWAVLKPAALLGCLVSRHRGNPPSGL